RTVIHSHNFQPRIVDPRQPFQRERQLFLFISRRKQQRNTRALLILGRSKILHPRQAQHAPRRLKSRKNPEKRREREEKKQHKMHGDWYQKRASGYPSMRWRCRLRSSARDALVVPWGVGYVNWAGPLVSSPLATNLPHEARFASSVRVPRRRDC